MARSDDQGAAETGAGHGIPPGRATSDERRAVKLKAANERWKESKDDVALVAEVSFLSDQFGKQKVNDTRIKRLCREDLEMICFEYISG